MSDPDRERETTVIHTDNGGGGGGTVIAVVLLIAVLGLLFYLFGGQLLGGKKTDVNGHVVTPAKPGGGWNRSDLEGVQPRRGVRAMTYPDRETVREERTTVVHT